jgi:hypothetical protein
MVTVVTEGIFSYCSFKVKIDTDRFLGPSRPTCATGRGGGPRHHGRIRLADAVAGRRAPPHRRQQERRPHHGRADAGAGQQEGGRVHHRRRLHPRHPGRQGAHRQRCRRAAHARGLRLGGGRHLRAQFAGVADEVVVVDDHITGVLTEHQAGRCLDMAPSGIQMLGRKSTPGRYFQVANPGNGWGGTDIADPLSIIEGWEEGVAGPACACSWCRPPASMRSGTCSTMRSSPSSRRCPPK